MRIKTTKEQDVVMAFFAAMLPKEWRGITTWDYEADLYRFEWDWIKTADGRYVRPDSGEAGPHMTIACVVRMEEVIKPPMNGYNKAIYVLAHKKDPPVELTEDGKAHLAQLAYAIIQGAKK